MSDEVRHAYDAVAELYASLNIDALDRDTNARDWLAAFAGLAAQRSGIVADLGCGPGHIVDHLCGLGLRVVGYDLSAGQIAQARLTFPGSEFHVGDLTALEMADSSLGGIVSRYSIIHLRPGDLGHVFEEWWRVLEPGAPVLVSFFGSRAAGAHGTPFDHKVATAYELYPPKIARQLRAVGLTDIEIGVLPPPPESLRPFDQGTVLGRKPAG